jgi:hypothetical protein
VLVTETSTAPSPRDGFSVAARSNFLTDAIGRRR